MAARYLLDTNICIYVRRHRPTEVLARFRRLKSGDAAISTVTWGELLYGAEKSQHRKAMMLGWEEFSASIPILPLVPQVGAAYGGIRAALESKGTTIGNNDLWIAAHAKALGLTLVSNNTREFERVPGLKLQNWVA
jgi:tRNA(fMet)-specific endonuclease VapC